MSKVITYGLVGTAAAVAAGVFFVEVVARLAKRFVTFPIPPFFAWLLDNPLRWLLDPPGPILDFLGVGGGMRVLEVGPGGGTLALAAGRRVGPRGRVVAADVQPAIARALARRVKRGLRTNVCAVVAAADRLPFAAASFDRVNLLGVLGEIPDKVAALAEVRRVLKDSGLLAVGEFALDPDYPRRATVIEWCRRAGLAPSAARGSWIRYTLTFRKAV